MADPANHEDDIEAVIARLEDDAAGLRDENPEDERAANMEVAAATIRSLCKQLDDAHGVPVPFAPREIAPEMMTEAAKRVGFDPVPGKLTRLAGVLNAILAPGVDVPQGQEKDRG